jgi:hypothetical protein
MTDDRQLAVVVRLDVWLDVACLFRTKRKKPARAARSM